MTHMSSGVSRTRKSSIYCSSRSLLLFLLLALLLLFFINPCSAVPTDWADEAKHGDILFHLGNPLSDSSLNPSVANGYVGGVLSSQSAYAAGVYVGDGQFYEDFKGATRARIPWEASAASISLAAGPGQAQSSLQIIGTALHFRSATMEQRYVLSPSNATVSLRWYAHRSRRSLLVLDVEIDASATVAADLDEREEGQVQVFLHIPVFNSSKDIDFAIAPGSNATYNAWTGLVVRGETADAHRPLVALVTHHPDMSQPLVVDAGATKRFAFPTVIRSDLDGSDPLADARADLASALSVSPAKLLQEHVAAWADIWQGGVSISGNLTMATHINSTFYYLFSQNRADWPWPAAPGGLASDGYNGNAFWDGDTFIIPSIGLFQPAVRQAALDYRIQRISQAEAHATKHGWSGTYFPWQTAYTGEDVSVFPSANILEQHVVSEVSLLVQRHFRFSGDTDWLRQVGEPISTGVADFWMSRLVPRAGSGNDGQLSILNVVPADEFAIGNLSLSPSGPGFPYTGVDDSVFTNVGAKLSLLWAAAISDILQLNSSRAFQYRDAADKITILFDEDTQTHPEYLGFPDGNWFNGGKVKQADVICVGWPLRFAVEPQVRFNNLQRYQPLYFADGPDMTFAVSAIANLELVGQSIAGADDDALRASALADFDRARLNQQTPFDVWTETPDPTKHDFDLGSYNFMTGASGWALVLTYGYAGIRLESNSLEWAPQLLDHGVSGLLVRGVVYLGWTFDVDCSNESGALLCSILPQAWSGNTQLAAKDASGAVTKFQVRVVINLQSGPRTTSTIASPFSILPLSG